MAYKRIARWKIEKVAKILSNPLDEQIQGLKNQRKELVENKLMIFVDDEVLRLWKKFPKYVIKQDSVRVTYLDKDYDWVYPNCPKITELENAEDLISNDLILMADLEKIHKEILEIKKAKKVFIKKVECTLENLRSYKKIQEEFPEAFKVLIEQVDQEGSVEEHTNMCDSVENVRAELSSFKTEENEKGK